jgi:Holliday junction resolvase
VFSVVAVGIVVRKGGSMLEKDIVAAIMRHLKTTENCFAWKTHGGMYSVAGIPDIICCLNGRFVAFEVKTETGKLTKLQGSTIARIKAAKGKAFMVTSLQEAKEILQNLNS